MIVAKRAGLGARFRLLEDGREIADVHPPVLRGTGTIEAEGRTFAIRRDGFLRPQFRLVDGDHTLAHAEPAFLGSFEVTALDRRFTLKRTRLFLRRYELLHGERAVGSLTPTSPLSFSAEVDLPADLPIATRAFLAFIVLRQWHRAAAAAG